MDSRFVWRKLCLESFFWQSIVVSWETQTLVLLSANHEKHVGTNLSGLVGNECLHTFEKICQTHPQREAAFGRLHKGGRPSAAPLCGALRGWVWQVFSNVWRYACSNVSRQVGSNVFSIHFWKLTRVSVPNTKTFSLLGNDPTQHIFGSLDDFSSDCCFCQASPIGALSDWLFCQTTPDWASPDSRPIGIR